MNLHAAIRFNRYQWSRLCGEIVLAGGALYSADGLAHLRLRPGAFLLLWAAFAVAGFVALVSGARGWKWFGLNAALLATTAGILNLAAGLRFNFGQIAYLGIFLAVLLAVYRELLRRREKPEGADAGEPLRLMAAAMIGLGAIIPFTTDHFLGGSDAQWYGGVMVDFLEQARMGKFPIFTGEGEFVFNGGVHPFRSAPLFLWVGGVCDWLTCRALSPLAVIHLTAVISSVLASAGIYLALSALVPARRWFAVAATLVFACCPATLAAIYSAEAYMTFATMPWLVAAFFGNALMLRGRMNEGAWWAVVGLALVWLAHPSVGMVATLVSAVLQAAWLLVHRRTGREWLAAAGWALLFVLLTGFYFVSMSETTTGQGGFSARSVGFFASLALLGWSLWAVERRRFGAAFSGAMLALAASGWAQPVLGVYVLAALGLHLGVMALRGGFRRSSEPVPASGRALEWITLSLVAAGFLAAFIVGKDFPGKNEVTDPSLVFSREAFSLVFSPVPKGAVCLGGFQLGWAMVALFGLALAGALVSSDTLTRVFAAGALGLALAYVPLPRFAEFFWGVIPPEITRITSMAFDRRLLPVGATLAVFAGFFGVTGIPRAGWQRAATVLLVCLLPWSVWEAGKFVHRGFDTKAPWARTKLFYLPETALLTRYAYDMLKLPEYMSHGVMDYRLETRVLEPTDFSRRFGPDEYARVLEKNGVRELVFTARPQDPPTVWLLLSPFLEVPVGADDVLRFEFSPTIPPGYLIMPSVGGPYREYMLPSSGFQFSFGSGEKNHSVVPLRNTGSETVSFHLEYLRTGQFSPEQGQGHFARVLVSKLDPSLLPVNVTSLHPYRARVHLESPAWLETFRAWLPGYEARVNGRPVELRESQQHQVMFPVPAGVSEVELRFVGTRRVRLAMAVSALAWLGLAGFTALHLRKKTPW